MADAEGGTRGASFEKGKLQSANPTAMLHTSLFLASVVFEVLAC